MNPMAFSLASNMALGFDSLDGPVPRIKRMPLMTTKTWTIHITLPTWLKKSKGSKRSGSEDGSVTSVSSQEYGGGRSNICSTVQHRHRLLRTGEFADCTVIFNGRKKELHKVVICYASDFFMKAIKSPMREGRTGVIELFEEPNDDDLERMFKFMYEDVYRDKHACEIMLEEAQTSGKAQPSRFDMVQATIEEIWVDLRMYAIGKRYLMKELKASALESFRKGLESEILHPVTVYRMEPTETRRYVPNDPSTISSIIDLARRTHLEGEDLSAEHKEAVFNLCFTLYPCMMKFPEFREALSGDLSCMAAQILMRVTTDRTERMIESCCGCTSLLMEEAAMELTSWCHTCKRQRRQEDMRLDEEARSHPLPDRTALNTTE